MATERENIDVTVRLRDELSRPARAAEESVDSLRESTDDLSESMEKNEKATDGAAAAAESHAEAVDTSTDSTDRNTDSTTRNTREKRRNREEGGRVIGTLSALAKATGGLSKTISRLTGGGGGGLKGMKAGLIGLLVVAVVPFLYAAGGAIVALAAAAYAGVAALAPLVGLLGALPALLAGLGQSFATVKLGFSGMGEALKVLNDPDADPEAIAAALAKLSPAGRDFAATMSELKNQTSGWGKAVQSAMLPGFTKVLKALGPLLPIVEKGLVGTGAAMGDLASNVAGFVGRSGKDLGTIMDRNTRMLRNGFGPALMGVIRILRDLMITAGPVAERFANWLGEASGRMADLTGQARRSGELTAFFDRAGDRAAAFFGSLKDLGLALYNIGVESKVMGDAMGAGLGGAIADLRAWTESETGKAAIRGFFQDAIGPLMELSRMVLGLTQAMGGLASSPALEPLLKQMRTELGPAIGQMMSSLNSGLGTAVIDIFTGLATAIGALPIQPLTTLVKIIGDLSLGFGNLLANNPAIASVAATLLSLLVAGKVAAVGFGLASKAFTAGAAAAKVAKAGAVAASWAFTGTVGPLNKMTKAQKIAAVSGRLLGLAFRFMLGPIGIAITVVALIIGLFVLLYKKNDAFRALVDRVAAAVVSFGKKAWEIIKRVATVVWDSLVGAFQKMWPIVKGVFTAIWNVIKTVFGIISAYVKVVIWVWKTYFEILIGVAIIVFKGIWMLIKPILGWIGAGFRALKDRIVANWNMIKAGAAAAWKPIAAGAAWVIGKMKAGFAIMKAFILPIWNRIKDGAQSSFDGIMKHLSPIISRVKSLFRSISAVVRGVWDGLSAGLSSAMDGIKGIINTVIGGINKAIDGVNKVKVGDDIGHIPTLYTGGAVGAGTTAFVGEHGPEMFLRAGGGPARMVGVGGPELRTFAQPGYVVPNPSTPSSMTRDLPSWVEARLSDPAVTAAPVPAGRGHAEGPMPEVPAIHMHLAGDGSALTPADVEAAALRAYRRWKREQEERR